MGLACPGYVANGEFAEIKFCLLLDFDKSSYDSLFIIGIQILKAASEVFNSVTGNFLSQVAELNFVIIITMCVILCVMKPEVSVTHVHVFDGKAMCIYSGCNFNCDAERSYNI